MTNCRKCKSDDVTKLSHDDPHCTQLQCFDCGHIMTNHYIGATIQDIHRGAKVMRGGKEIDRTCHVYAKLVAKDGTVLIQATLDYITQALLERLP